MVPNSRPQQAKEKTLAMVIKAGIEDRVALVGIRGYYSETFAPSGNQRGIYDDAIILLSPSVLATAAAPFPELAPVVAAVNKEPTT